MDIMSRWLFVGLILLLSISNINATEIYSDEGAGSVTAGGTYWGLHPNSYASNDPITYIVYETFTLIRPDDYSSVGNDINLQSADTPSNNFLSYYSTHLNVYEPDTSKTISGSYTKTVSGGWDNGQLARIQTWGTLPSGYYRIGLIVTTDGIYNLTGYVECVDEMAVDMNNSGTWITVYYNESNQEHHLYDIPIALDVEYRIMCDGYNVHQFVCSSDESFSHNACPFVYGYTCNIDSISLWRYEGDSWVYQGVESQWKGYDTYEMQIEEGYNYRLNFSDGHIYFFTCMGSDVRYDWDRCEWVYPPSPYQPPEIIPWTLGYDNNIVFMRDCHGNFIKNSQTSVYNKANHTYTQKWTDTPESYVLLAANNDSDDEVIVMCKTFDGVFTLETTDPAFGTDENITWTNWTIPIMYNLEIRPIDQSNVPLHDVFVSMYEYTPLDPLSFFGYDTYWGHTPITNCSGFSRCDIVAEKDGYADYNITGLNWTSKSAMIKDYKQDIVMVKE